jgi:hypothetical protein
MGVQFYKKALWCLEAEFFEVEEEEGDLGDARGVRSEQCSLYGKRLDEIAGQAEPVVNLEGLLLTTYVALQRAFKRCGRPHEAEEFRMIMEDSIEKEMLGLLGTLENRLLDPGLAGMLVV